MKKILLILGISLILTFILIYAAIWSTNDKADTDILVNIDNVESIDFKKLDSVTIAANSMYTANELKKAIQGEHYRKAWAMPIKVPVIYLDTVRGGLIPVERGGGKQTSSLKLKASDGVIYTLRSVAKDPEALVPDYARVLGLENIVIDGISAQHPYGAQVVARLAESINVLHTHPVLVFVPKQESLKEFNEEYGNKLYWLEYETEGKENWTTIKNTVEIMDTDDLQEFKLKYGDRVTIDKGAMIRARLLDLLIGDWDRHAKQWGWVVHEIDNYYSAIPLPGDRDNAFFDIDGLIPSFISSKEVKPELRPFEKEIDYLPGMVQSIDRYFLIDISTDLFVKEARYIQSKLTDNEIDRALSSWPKEIQKLDAQAIKVKLQQRRDDIVEYAREFKRIIDEKGVLSESLNGSEDLKLPVELMQCFSCNENKSRSGTN